MSVQNTGWVGGKSPSQKVLDIAKAAGEKKKEEEAVQAVQDNINNKLSSEMTAADTAASLNAQEQADTAKNAYLAGITAGVGKSKAGMLADNVAENNYGNNLANTYQATSNAATQANADYMQKQAQLKSMQNQANNLNNASLLTSIGGGLQGAAAGFGLATTSDERCKEAPEDSPDPVSEDKLQEAVKEFKDLYVKLQELKKKQSQGKAKEKGHESK